MAAIAPRQLLTRPDDLILDIRPLAEREGDLGYIPGSVSLPDGELDHSADDLLALANGRSVVLVCLSGKRAQGRIETLRASPQAQHLALSFLEGGMLEWGAQGLPLVHTQLTSQPDVLVELKSLEDFPRAVVSCFVAESIETQLDAGRSEVEDPSMVVRELFDQALRGGQATPEHFRALLDRLADRARQMGHSLEHIAVNLETMRSALRPFDSHP